MVHVTLVGERLAKEGAVFIFRAPLLECRECKYKQVCFNLEGGKRYKVTKVRDAKHDCEIHEGGVRAVEVEEVPVEAGVTSRISVEGSLVTLEEKGCKNRGCENYLICHPPMVKTGEKYKIKKILGKMDCPEGEKITRVLLEL